MVAAVEEVLELILYLLDVVFAAGSLKECGKFTEKVPDGVDWVTVWPRKHDFTIEVLPTIDIIII